MKVLLQRVRGASVTVENECIAKIAAGLVLLTGFGKGDDDAILRPMAEKIANLRIFPNVEGKFDKSVLDVSGSVLVVSQFTLYGDTSKGRRPDFYSALEPEKAEQLVTRFAQCFEQAGIQKVQSGQFGAHMVVAIENDGPVTMMLES